MVNPFDRDFYKFFIGFVCILGFSFCLLYVVGQYSHSTEKQAAAVQK